MTEQTEQKECGERLYHETVAECGKEITDDWLRVHVRKLKELPFHDTFAWGWTMLMASPQLRLEFREDLFNSYQSKPEGCQMCAEKVATKYHILIGRVCDGCFDTLSKQEQEMG